MRFTFATAGEIRFGAGVSADTGRCAARLGRRALWVTGSRPQRAEDLIQKLERAGVSSSIFSITGEPTIDQVADGAVHARDQGCDLVIGMGGGSVLDSAKAIAALATNTRPIETYLEVIGEGRDLDTPPLPCIALPTTAGTGSEVTRNAVLRSAVHQVKISLRSPEMLPRLAIVDPELTFSVPPDITAYTGCDALTQLLESFVSSKANPFTDGLCREGLPRAARALPQAVRQGRDPDARTAMSLASLFSGITLANAGLGAVHGIAGPMGGMIVAPHGALCAALLPHVMAINLEVEQRANPDGAFLKKFEEATHLLTGRPKSSAADGIRWLHELIQKLHIPPLTHWGFAEQDIAELVPKAQAASSMKGNPIRLSDADISAIILKAMEGP
jgi:alcohol dehydrogenase class IV